MGINIIANLDLNTYAGLGCCCYIDAYVISGFWQYILLFSWIISFSLIPFHFNNKTRKFTPLLLCYFFMVEIVTLAFWLTIEDNPNMFSGIILEIISTHFMCAIIYFILMFMMLAALRLFLLAVVEFVARKMDTNGCDLNVPPS